MIARLQNPVVISVLALVTGLASGLGWFWRAAEQIVAAAARAAAEHAAPVEPEREKGWDFWTIEIDNLASELKGEKARLKQESDQLDLRAARLAAEQQELGKVRTELEALRREIDEKTFQIGADEAKNLKALAQTYSNLTPRAAVAIIRDLDDATVVKILGLMKPDVVAPIFEEMSRATGPDGPKVVQRAAALSEKLRLLKAVKPAQPAS
jgi:flagellar motility protein MotE (MotC chaperone)